MSQCVKYKWLSFNILAKAATDQTDVVSKDIQQSLIRQVLHEYDDLGKPGRNCGALVW